MEIIAGINIVGFACIMHTVQLIQIPSVLHATGVVFYNAFLRSVAIKKVFFWSAMLLIAVHLSQVVLITGDASNASMSAVLDLCCSTPIGQVMSAE